MKDCLPKHIAEGRHTDYLWPLSYIPRRWTSFCWHQPPKKILGNQELTWFDKYGMFAPKPIPKPGQWQVSSIKFGRFWIPLIFAGTTKGGWSWRFGARFDDEDFYMTAPTFKIWKLS